MCCLCYLGTAMQFLESMDAYDLFIFDQSSSKIRFKCFLNLKLSGKLKDFDEIWEEEYLIELIVGEIGARRVVEKLHVALQLCVPVFHLLPSLLFFGFKFKWMFSIFPGSFSVRIFDLLLRGSNMCLDSCSCLLPV